jgi:hypothetical protein
MRQTEPLGQRASSLTISPSSCARSPAKFRDLPGERGSIQDRLAGFPQIARRAAFHRLPPRRARTSTTPPLSSSRPRFGPSSDPVNEAVGRDDDVTDSQLAALDLFQACRCSLAPSATKIDRQLFLRSVLVHLPGLPWDELPNYLRDGWNRDLMAEQRAALNARHAAFGSNHHPVRRCLSQRLPFNWIVAPVLLLLRLVFAACREVLVATQVGL